MTQLQNFDHMPYYRVVLNGENIWLQMEGRPQRVGFFATRFVKASSPDQAGKAALRLIRSEDRLKLLNSPEDAPRILAGEIEEVEEADVPENVYGFAFFPDEPEASE